MFVVPVDVFSSSSSCLHTANFNLHDIVFAGVPVRGCSLLLDFYSIYQWCLCASPSEETDIICLFARRCLDAASPIGAFRQNTWVPVHRFIQHCNVSQFYIILYIQSPAASYATTSHLLWFFAGGSLSVKWSGHCGVDAKWNEVFLRSRNLIKPMSCLESSRVFAYICERQEKVTVNHFRSLSVFLQGTGEMEVEWEEPSVLYRL